MLPAGGVAGFLHVYPEIDLVGQHLDMALRLHPAAHDAKRFPRFAIFHDEPGNDGLKRPFARRVNIGVARLHREKLAAILKHEAEPGHDDAAAHAAIIALNERYHVAFVIGGAHVNRVALLERGIAGLDCFRGAVRVD